MSKFGSASSYGPNKNQLLKQGVVQNYPCIMPQIFPSLLSPFLLILIRYFVRSAAGTSVSLGACERVTSDFEGIAHVGKLRSSKKK